MELTYSELRLAQHALNKAIDGFAAQGRVEGDEWVDEHLALVVKIERELLK